MTSCINNRVIEIVELIKFLTFFQTKPVHIPEKSKEYKPRDPLEFVRNIWGKINY